MNKQLRHLVLARAGALKTMALVEKSSDNAPETMAFRPENYGDTPNSMADHPEN